MSCCWWQQQWCCCIHAAVTFVSFVVFFVSPPRLPLAIPSKRGDMRNSGKGSEVEKDWKRENMKGEEGSKRQDCHTEDSLSPTRPMEKKKKTWRPWGREDVRTCQNRLALRYYSDMPSTSDRTSERSYQTLWKVLTFFVEDFVALMCQSWLSYLLQKTSAA